MKIDYHFYCSILHKNYLRRVTFMNLFVVFFCFEEFTKIKFKAFSKQFDKFFLV